MVECRGIGTQPLLSARDGSACPRHNLKHCVHPCANWLCAPFLLLEHVYLSQDVDARSNGHVAVRSNGVTTTISPTAAAGAHASSAEDRSWQVPVTSVERHEGLGISGWVAPHHLRAAAPPHERQASHQNAAGSGAASASGRDSVAAGAQSGAVSTGVDHSASAGGGADADGNVRIAVGNRKLMEALGVSTGGLDAAAWLRREEDVQRTVLFAAVGATLVACLSVEDPIVPEARGVVAALKKQRVRPAHLRLLDRLRRCFIWRAVKVRFSAEGSHCA